MLLASIATALSHGTRREQREGVPLHCGQQVRSDKTKRSVEVLCWTRSGNLVLVHTNDAWVTARGCSQHRQRLLTGEDSSGTDGCEGNSFRSGTTVRNRHAHRAPAPLQLVHHHAPSSYLLPPQPPFMTATSWRHPYASGRGPS